MARITTNKLQNNVQILTAKINVFSFCRNTVSDDADVMSSGRQFHSFGPTEANDCSPDVTRHDGWTVS